MLTKQFRQFEQWAEDQEKSKQLKQNKQMKKMTDLELKQMLQPLLHNVNKVERSNKPMAELMIAMMQYVLEEDYYPEDYYEFLDLQVEYDNNELSDDEYVSAVNDIRLRWNLKKIK